MGRASAVRGVSSHSLPGLFDDAPGGLQQVGQVVDRAGQPPAPPPRRGILNATFAQLVGLGPGPAQRSPGVDQQPLGLPGGDGGQLGQLPGDPPHGGRRLLPAGRRAGAQLGGDLVRSFPRRAGAVPHLGAHRAAGGLDPLAGRADATHRLGQQTGIGRIGHVRRHHRGIHPDPVGAQQLRFGRLGQQRLVEPGHRRRPTPRSQLHQRGRMRHRPVQRDPAKPPPSDRIGDLPTQRLIAQPVAELKKHQPQIRFHRRRRTTHPRVETRHERGEERLIREQRINASQLLGQPLQLLRQNRLPQRALIAYSTKHDGLNPFRNKGIEAILPAQRHPTAHQRADFFRSK